MMIDSDALLKRLGEFAPDDALLTDGERKILEGVRALVPDEPEFIIAFEIDDEYEPEHANHIRASIFCPHCGAEDTIVEVDISVRWNRLGELQIDREPQGDLPPGYRWASAYETEAIAAGRLAANHIIVKRTVDAAGNPYTQDEADVAVPDNALVWTNASTGDGNYDHDGWLCESCLGRSTAPEFFDINDWS